MIEPAGCVENRDTMRRACRQVDLVVAGPERPITNKSPAPAANVRGVTDGRSTTSPSRSRM